MKNLCIKFRSGALVCVMGVLVLGKATAQTSGTSTISPDDFKKLEEQVEKLSQQVQSLQQANADAQQTHEKDQQQIDQLKNNVDGLQATTADQAKTSTASQMMSPLSRLPIDETTVNHSFQILGDAEFQYDKTRMQNGGFAQTDFAPIFLYRASDNILFEAGFDFIIQNNRTYASVANGGTAGSGYNTTVNLSFAQLDYVFNDYVTGQAGNLLLPLGTYSPRSAGWLNKLPDAPFSRSLVPGNGVGAELSGAVPLGEDGKFINYSVFGVNGPSSSDGTGNAASLDLNGNVGFTSDGKNANLHGNPAGGGRVGIFLPFAPHTDLELGVSGIQSQWDDAESHLYTAGVLDAAFHLGPWFETKGEYIASRYGTDDLGQVRADGFWVQSSYKLAGLNLNIPVINNLELVSRYDDINDGMGTNNARTTAGFVYYFTNTLLFEGDYEFLNSHVPAGGTPSYNNLIFQISYGF